jgi:hypothetical protein
VRIPRFSLSSDTFQAADSPKYLIFSTRQFELPPDRPVTFAVDLAVKNIGGEPGTRPRPATSASGAVRSVKPLLPLGCSVGDARTARGCSWMEDGDRSASG